MSGSCAYVGRNSPEHQCIQFRGISEGEKYADDIRTACKFEIQIWEPKIIITTFLILGNKICVKPHFDTIHPREKCKNA